MFRWRRRSRRGASPIIATLFLVGITVAGGVILWTLHTRTPPQPVTIEYSVVGGLTLPAWGDGSDCTNSGGSQTCLLLPAFEFVFTAQSPGYLAVASLSFTLWCNGTRYLTASLPAMAWVPGTASTPGGSAPQLGKCGTYTPPNAAFNRLTYFDQLSPGAVRLNDGDEIVVYTHTFTAFKDDDFHGAPEWCYTTLNACSIVIAFTGTPQSDVITLPLYGIAS